MLNQSMLLDINPQLGLLNDIYQDTSNLFRDSALSNSIRIAVADVYAAAKDKSLYSMDIESLCNTDELRKALDPAAFNYLQALNMQGTNRALEISEDFGGVAHYLADFVNTLDSVKIDSDRSRLAAVRCLEKRNVCHISEDLDKLQFPAKHYDLIVIGRLESLKLSNQSQIPFWERLQASLTDNGVIVINARNAKRISRWLDSAADSAPTLIPFHHLYHSTPELEIDHQQLSKVMADAGFSTVDFHASFSSGDRCQNLFSKDYLNSNPNALNHFYRLGGIRNEQLNEYLFFKKLIADKTCVFDLASRFVIIAGSDLEHTRQFYDNDFAHFAGKSRKAQWRTFTRRARSASEVLKSLLHPHLDLLASEHSIKKSAEIHPRVSQNLKPQPFFSGRLLVDDWLHAVAQNDFKAFQSLVTEYHDWLVDRALQEDLAINSYDLLPFNIVLDETEGARRYQAIDIEWQIDGEISAEFVLFRALFWFAFQNRSLFKDLTKQHGLSSLGTFVVLSMPGISQVSELQEFVELEEIIQSQIDNNFRAKSVEHALLQPFDRDSITPETSYKCQLAWAELSGVTDEEHARYQAWDPAAGCQTVEISVSGFEAGRSVLRVDPFTGKSLFGFSSIKLLDANRIPLWELGSMSAIAKSAIVVNAKAIEIENGVACFAALSNDPHFLFDLSQEEGIANIRWAVVELDVFHDVNYSATLNTLTDALKDQNIALIGMSNTLNHYRAEQEYLKIRNAELIGHRTDLAVMLRDAIRDNNAIRNSQDRVTELKERIDQLNTHFGDQLRRNEELVAVLTARPVTRLKAFIRRLLSRASKQ